MSTSGSVADQPGQRPRTIHTTLHRLRRGAREQLQAPVAHFMGIGVLSTVAYALLYLTLRAPLGAAGGNALALALTAVANTQANRRFTFGVRGRAGLLRQHAAGALVYLLALGVTSWALNLLRDLDSHPAALLEVTVLMLASAVATISRYLALRTWVFSRERSKI